jgi:hypothetical protein
LNLLANKNTFIPNHFPSKLFCFTIFSRAVASINTITVTVGNAFKSIQPNCVYIKLKIMTLIMNITVILKSEFLTSSQRHGSMAYYFTVSSFSVIPEYLLRVPTWSEVSLLKGGSCVTVEG